MATLIFSTMPDLGMALSTLPDIDRHPELRMSVTRLEVEITHEQKEMARWRRDSNGYPSHFIGPEKLAHA